MFALGCCSVSLRNEGDTKRMLRECKGKEGKTGIRHKASKARLGVNIFPITKPLGTGRLMPTLGRKSHSLGWKIIFPPVGKKLFLGREIWLPHLGLQGTGACVRIFPIRTTKHGG